MHRSFAGTAAALACLLSACGGSGSGSSPPTSPTSPGEPASSVVTITIVRQGGAQSFSPNPASAGGRMVVFRNADSIVHRVRLNDGSIDTGDIAPGALSRSVLMPAAGTHYHCSVHPDMIGSVNPAAGGPPPSCEGPYCEGG